MLCSACSREETGGSGAGLLQPAAYEQSQLLVGEQLPGAKPEAAADAADDAFAVVLDPLMALVPTAMEVQKRILLASYVSCSSCGCHLRSPCTS